MKKFYNIPGFLLDKFTEDCSTATILHYEEVPANGFTQHKIYYQDESLLGIFVATTWDGSDNIDYKDRYLATREIKKLLELSK